MSSAQLEANISELPDEPHSYMPKKSGVAIEPDRFAAVVHDDVISPLEGGNRMEIITEKKAEENNIRDKHNNFETRDKGRDVPARKRKACR